MLTTHQCNWKVQQCGQKASGVARRLAVQLEGAAYTMRGPEMSRDAEQEPVRLTEIKQDQARHCGMLWDGSGNPGSQEML